MATLRIIVFIVIILEATVSGQKTGISPKLDFEDNLNENNSSSATVEEDDSNEGTKGGSVNSISPSHKAGPKILGVRVTVDTGDNENSNESKESVENSNVGKHKKRVGIHTDITFDITATGNDGVSNMTRSAQEDASVPIINGRVNLTEKPQRTHNPKPNSEEVYSSERHIYIDSRLFPWYIDRATHYRSYAQSDVGRDLYPDMKNDGWHSFIPSIRAWTTERNYDGPHRLEERQKPKESSWDYCFCMSTINRRKSGSNYERSRSVIGVSDKVDHTSQIG